MDKALQQLSSHGVKTGRIAIRNPVVSDALLHQCSVDACNILIKAILDGGGLNAEAHNAIAQSRQWGMKLARLDSRMSRTLSMD